MQESHTINLVKTNYFNIYKVKMQQFLKACVSQNFVSNPNLILGEIPRIICVDVEGNTRTPINYYFPLHKNFFMYFNRIAKIVNRERLENFIDFLLRYDIYEYENNMEKGIDISSIKERLSEIILDPGRIVGVYYPENLFVELLKTDCEEYIKHSFYNDNFEQFFKTNKFSVPLFFNIVEKGHSNIVGFLDKDRINDYRMIPISQYKYIKANPVDHFRQIILERIGEIFTYCPYVYPKSRLQYQLLSQMYQIKETTELSYYQYMFLLHSNNISRKCLYPLNFNVFERIEVDDLTTTEVSLLSDYYMIPIKKLQHNHLHFMPINEIGRSLLILEQDVMLHRYTTDPPLMFDCVEQYVYNDGE